MKRIGWMLLGLFLGLALNPPFSVIADDADQRLQPGRGDIELKMDRPVDLQQLRRQLTEISEKIDLQLKRQSQELEELASLRAKRC
ncbi:MAG: hypothetical protein HY208_06160 [Nitrospirae bacterium]|nr:hypothetical protein [Nitrospirota bacterium]